MIDWEARLPEGDSLIVAKLRAEGACPIVTADWRRLPNLWNICLRLLGRPMYAYQSNTRQKLDQSMGHACRVWIDKYPARCTRERMETCVALLEHALSRADPDAVRAPIPYVCAIIRATINKEETHIAQKAHVPKTRLNLPSVFKQE